MYLLDTNILIYYFNGNMEETIIDSAYNTKFDLSDLLIACSAHSFDCQSILTFDKKASKFKYFELLK